LPPVAKHPGRVMTPTSLTSGALWTLAARAAFALSGLLTNALLTRLMTPADFGCYLLAVSLVAVLTMLSQCGLQVAVVRFVSEALNRGAQASARRIALTCALLALCGGAVVGIAYAAGGSQLLARVLGADSLRDSAVAIALWIAVATPLGVLGE